MLRAKRRQGQSAKRALLRLRSRAKPACLCGSPVPDGERFVWSIYINGHGTDIAIRQEDQFDTDEPVVIVPIDSAEKVANRILELAKVIRAGDFEPIPEAAEPAQRPLALPAPALTVTCHAPP